MRHLLLFALLILTGMGLYAQPLLTPLNDDYDTGIKQAVYNPHVRFHTSIKPYLMSDLNKQFSTDSLMISRRINKTYNASWHQKAFDKLFNTDLVTLKGVDYSIVVNPLLQFEYGNDNRSNKSTWINTRGFEVKGTLGNRFAFYTAFRENQAVFPAYLDANIRKSRVVPGQGLIRSFGNNGFDYAYSTAYISYNAMQWFNIQLGNGRNFLGDGYRSLLLSDNAFPNAYLKLTADFWHIKYTALYSQLIDIRDRVNYNLGYDRKYTTIHYLSWAATPRLNISVFDAIIWQAADSLGQRGFDLQYLNPVIFLRPVEFSIGSPDNAMMGLNISYILAQSTVVYGQLVIDEFKLKEVTAGNGWWGNKQAFQLGIKSHQAFGIGNLFLQTEFNWVRPYMYTHFSELQNYGHYNQPLAHPWGANFWESVSRLRYNYKRWYIHNELLFGLYGDDLNGGNYGHDIYQNYNTRVQDYNNSVGQGLKTEVFFNDLTLSYLLNPAYRLNLYAGLTLRRMSNDLVNEDDLIFRMGIRTSLERFYVDF